MTKEKKEKYCSNCKCEITGMSWFKCLDNFLQHKYFDTEEENVFCCPECFCEYMALKPIDNEDFDFDFGWLNDLDDNE